MAATAQVGPRDTTGPDFPPAETRLVLMGRLSPLEATVAGRLGDLPLDSHRDSRREMDSRKLSQHGGATL